MLHTNNCYLIRFAQHTKGNKNTSGGSDSTHSYFNSYVMHTSLGISYHNVLSSSYRDVYTMWYNNTCDNTLCRLLSNKTMYFTKK